MADDNKEVNEDTEVVKVEEQEATDQDELVTSEEKETPSEPSADEKPEESTEEKSEEKLVGRSLPEGEKSTSAEQEANLDFGDTKPIEGETLRERALRWEVQKLKGRMRDVRKKELFETDSSEAIASPASTSKPNREVLSKYDPQELQNLKEVLNVYADELGFVRKDEFKVTTYQQGQAAVLDEFLKEHPEYMPENDPDNLLWNHFKEEVSLYRAPEDPREYRKIFNKAHSSVLGIAPSSEKAKIAAQHEKLKSVSHTVGKGSSDVRKAKPAGLSPELRQHLKGFDDTELDELGL